SLDNLVVEATGSVPGRPLNQFALDQHDGYLRVATTVGEGGFVGLGSLSFGMGGSSANDVYVLDGDLDLAGSVTGLGLTERIYSARFVGDTGYLVTFRQIDPFYVFDLSDPRNPKRTGELKIPGFSSYLHPVGANHVIGVGRENNGVKVSLFDVADPTRPAEADKLILDSVVSDVLENHRAFLIDEKHSVFFVPGSPNGYVISYSGGVLKIVKELAGSGFRRALFIDDYLYVISDSQITVLDENDWETVGGLDLNE
ncbi:MAG: beta-propeller domain-containing protein, partial [Terriglobia bacterium]